MIKNCGISQALRMWSCIRVLKRGYTVLRTSGVEVGSHIWNSFSAYLAKLVTIFFVTHMLLGLPRPVVTLLAACGSDASGGA